MCQHLIFLPPPSFSGKRSECVDFLVTLQGEFNSGKSTFINALLGERYLKDGVIPSTNEITFLRYSELDSNKPQRCERNPDDQYVCYLSAPILKDVSCLYDF